MKKWNALLLYFLFLPAMLMTSCEKWDPWDEGNGGGGKPPQQECSVTGRLVRVPCGISDLDNFWIRTDNGVYYQPCDASLFHRMDVAYTLEEGMYVTFGFEPITGSSICDAEYLMLCPERIPERKQIKLTCFRPLVIRCGTGSN